MDLSRLWVVAPLLLGALIPPSISHASEEVDDSQVAWAYGSIVDSITIRGNRDTRSFVILREMETRPGSVLEERFLHRDLRFIYGLSPIETVYAKADSLSPGHVALRLRVTERSQILVSSILPVLKYSFETGVTYGVRWTDRNFRGRLQNLAFTYTRNEREDNAVSFGWSTPWIGWHHISMGAGISYYRRGDVPATTQVLEQSSFGTFIGLPLTTSRVAFAQLEGSVSLAKQRTGGALEGLVDEPPTNRLTITETIGYRFDSRDNHVRPEMGLAFFMAVSATELIQGEGDPYYRLRNEYARFVRVSQKGVLAFLSNFQYQFGDFPSYSLLKLGGPNTLRGYPFDRFEGFHRWFGTAEWRYLYFPRRVYRLPYVPYVNKLDVGLGLVVFVDSGIAWSRTTEFDLDHLHGTGGIGLRFYSPIRNVLRIDYGFNLSGAGQFNIAAGVRF